MDSLIRYSILRLVHVQTFQITILNTLAGHSSVSVRGRFQISRAAVA